MYFQQHSGTGDDTFIALVNIENKIDLLREESITQKKKLQIISKNRPTVLYTSLIWFFLPL